MLYKRFSEVMLKASIHFKRLNISLEDFYSIPNYVASSRTSNEINTTAINKSSKDKEKEKEEILTSETDKDEASRQRKLLMEINGQITHIH